MKQLSIEEALNIIKGMLRNYEDDQPLILEVVQDWQKAIER